MTSLVDLEFSGNYLVGQIPKEIGLLKNLQHLELYHNLLSGNKPEEIGNLTELIDLDMSVNWLTGKIPKSIWDNHHLWLFQTCQKTILEVLCQQRFAREVNCFTFLSFKICSLEIFLIVTQNVSLFYGLELVIAFQRGLCLKDYLILPHTSLIDLTYNNFTAPLPITIEYPINLSQLYVQGNWISGVIPPSISQTSNLIKLDLSNNLLSGPIPSEIGYLEKLNLLLLRGNKLNSSIPSSLSMLKSLYVLDLSNNLLTGSISQKAYLNCYLTPSTYQTISFLVQLLPHLSTNTKLHQGNWGSKICNLGFKMIICQPAHPQHCDCCNMEHYCVVDET